MLCKIWGLHDGDYEECRLLGYKNPVLTSQETHYVSATEPNRLMLCKISGFHGGHYGECRLLECYAVWFLYECTCRSTASIIRVTSIGELGTTLTVNSNRSTLRKYTTYRSVLRFLVTANIPSSPNSCHNDDGYDMFLRNVGFHKRHTV
jgi:hypothetical protein